MSEIQEAVRNSIQTKINNKSFDHQIKKNWRNDFFGNRVGTRLTVDGSTQGCTVEFEGESSNCKVILDLSWHYHRTEFRGVRPAIQEDRNDSAKLVFRVSHDPIGGLSWNEIERQQVSVSTSHDSAKTAFGGLMEDVIKPNFH